MVAKLTQSTRVNARRPAASTDDTPAACVAFVDPFDGQDGTDILLADADGLQPSERHRQAKSV